MKNEASIEIQIPLSLSYSLIYQGEASPLKWSSHPWVRLCVHILTPPLLHIYRPDHWRENTPSTPGMHLGSTEETTRGRWVRTALRWGQRILGRLRSCRLSSGWLLGGSQGREVAPWIRVLAFDWSKVCFLGSMRCHGHVGACVPTCRHIALCGSHWAHMMSCAYLSHPGSNVCKWYIHFDRLDEHVTMV
jgi:hypothetical protein